jgi:hypothetical protein
MCDCSPDGFTAIATQEGSARMLRVAGECTCPQSGYTLTLAWANPGIVPHPEEVVLELRAMPPATGADVLTPTRVQFDAEIGEAAERVVIRRSDQDTLTLPITNRDERDVRPH